jgi:hypothetical protein
MSDSVVGDDNQIICEIFGVVLRNERKVCREKIALICVRNECVNGKSKGGCGRKVRRGGRKTKLED